MAFLSSVEKPVRLASSGPGAGTPSTVTYIDPSQLIGESLILCFQQHDKISEFEWHPSVTDWLSQAENPAALVILRDTVGPQQTSAIVEAIELLREKAPETAFVVISDHDNCGLVQFYLEKGARGYISTEMSLAVSVQILQLVMAGGLYVPVATLMKMVEQRSKAPQPASAASSELQNQLTPKELLVARKLRQGTPNKVIAYDLNMCESTVKVHVRTLMRKLGAKNRTQVAYISDRFLSNAEC